MEGCGQDNTPSARAGKRFRERPLEIGGPRGRLLLLDTGRKWSQLVINDAVRLHGGIVDCPGSRR
jgi:hypothetical protein